MKRGGRFSYLVLLIHFFAFATTATTHIATDPCEGSKAKLFVEVTAENSSGAPLDKSSKETSSSQEILTPSREKSRNNEMRDASTGAEDEGEIILEEGHGDHRQNLLDTALEFYQASQELWSRGELKEAIDASSEQ
jgi:hypothetical protein